MPQFQMVDFGPSPISKIASNFGKGFSESIKKEREAERKQDIIDKILGSEQINQNPSNQNVSTVQTNQEAPDNLTQILHSVNQHPDILAKQGIVSGQNPQTNKVNRLTAQKMSQLEILDPNIAKALKPVFDSQNQKDLAQTKADVKRSSAYLADVDKIRESLPKKQSALNQIEDAIKNRSNLDFLGDVLADYTGQESLRSAKGSQMLSATKEFFFSNIHSIPGVRLNQFLEKNLSSALTDPRRKDEANQMVVAGMRQDILLDKYKSEITSQLEQYYRNTLGHVPYDISNQVDKALVPVANKLQDQWAMEVAGIVESKDRNIQKFIQAGNDPKKRKQAASHVALKEVTPGAILTETMGQILLEKYNDDPIKALKTAKKLGYRIPGE